MSISPRTCQSSPSSCHSPPALVNLTRVAGGARRARGRRGANIGARAARRVQWPTCQPSPGLPKVPDVFQVSGKFQGGPVRPSPPPKKIQVAFKKNLRFFLNVGVHVRSITFATKSKFTKFPAHLPNFLRLYQISCGFPGNLVNFQGGGRGGHVGHLTLSHTSWVKWGCPTGRPEGCIVSAKTETDPY